jgi:hypothetical protein
VGRGSHAWHPVVLPACVLLLELIFSQDRHGNSSSLALLLLPVLLDRS